MKLFLRNTKLAFLVVATGLLAACSAAPSAEDIAAANAVNSTTSTTTTPAPSAVDPDFTNTQNQAFNNDADAKIYNGYSKNDLVARYNTVYFAFDSYVPQEQYAKVIQAHAEFIKQTGAKVLLEGYTDERGTPQYNVTLGSERARAVSQQLVKLGVPATSIRQLSYGEEKPAVFGHTEAEYAKNRRVVFNYSF